MMAARHKVGDGIAGTALLRDQTRVDAAQKLRKLFTLPVKGRQLRGQIVDEPLLKWPPAKWRKSGKRFVHYLDRWHAAFRFC